MIICRYIMYTIHRYLYLHIISTRCSRFLLRASECTATYLMYIYEATLRACPAKFISIWNICHQRGKTTHLWQFMCSSMISTARTKLWHASSHIIKNYFLTLHIYDQIGTKYVIHRSYVINAFESNFDLQSWPDTKSNAWSVFSVRIRTCINVRRINLNERSLKPTRNSRARFIQYYIYKYKLLVFIIILKL